MLSSGALAGSAVAEVLGLSGAAFAGAVAALVLVVLLGRRRGGLQPGRVLPAGIVAALLVMSAGVALALTAGLAGPLRPTGRLAELSAGAVDQAEVLNTFSR